MKKSDFNLKSKCCNASVRTESGLPDFIGEKNQRIATMWYVCSECNQSCDTVEDDGFQEGYQPLSSNLNRSYASQLSLGEVNIAPIHLTPPWSVKITKVREGFLMENLEELGGDGEPQYHNVQNIFETAEREIDDLESFQRLVWFLIDHFAVASGSERRLEMSIYDPNAKVKKKGVK